MVMTLHEEFQFGHFIGLLRIILFGAHGFALARVFIEENFIGRRPDSLSKDNLSQVFSWSRFVQSSLAEIEAENKNIKYFFS